ncbi:MAG: hypothetical protein ABW275_09060 [Hansschlegelia sp.]
MRPAINGPKHAHVREGKHALPYQAAARRFDCRIILEQTAFIDDIIGDEVIV